MLPPTPELCSQQRQDNHNEVKDTHETKDLEKPDGVEHSDCMKPFLVQETTNETY